MNLNKTTSQIGSKVIIAPSAIVEEGVIIGDNTVISDHVIIRKYTKIGSNCKFYPYAVIGEEPQDYAFKGEPSFLEIGDDNVFREFSTVHRASGEGQATIIGHKNYFMNYSHIGHNSKIGSNNTFANGVQIAGHVSVDDFVTIGGLSAIHQHCKVGSYVMLSGGSASARDLAPYLTYALTPAVPFGVNRVGLKRAGISQEVRNEINKAFKILYQEEHSLPFTIRKIESELVQFEEIKYFIEFLKSCKRGIRTSGTIR
jgi:UDP-N-acetylglucosamine acyltransferase